MINELIQKCHANAVAKGFWDSEFNAGEKLMLIVSELSEALEAARSGDEENFAEELADSCIRIFDLCGHMNIDLEKAIESKTRLNTKRPHMHGRKF